MSERPIHCLDLATLSEIFGVDQAEVPKICTDLLDRFDFRFRWLTESEQETLLQGKARALALPLGVSGPDYKPKWEKGWTEVLNDFVRSGHQESALLPGYYRRGETHLWLLGRFMAPVDRHFRIGFLRILQAWISEKLFDDVARVYEFGCGPGHNLYAFARKHPHRTYWGTDWALASQAVLSEIRRSTGWDVNARQFDMFEPDSDFTIAPDSAVLTSGMLEQAGRNFAPFAEYLLRQPARVYVHLEPFRELHDPASPFGRLALGYMEKRNYLDGYLDHLRSLEAEGRIEISDCRTLLGSSNCADWNLVVWRKTG